MGIMVSQVFPRGGYAAPGIILFLCMSLYTVAVTVKGDCSSMVLSLALYAIPSLTAVWLQYRMVWVLKKSRICVNDGTLGSPTRALTSGGFFPFEVSMTVFLAFCSLPVSLILIYLLSSQVSIPVWHTLFLLTCAGIMSLLLGVANLAKYFDSVDLNKSIWHIRLPIVVPFFVPLLLFLFSVVDPFSIGTPFGWSLLLRVDFPFFLALLFCTMRFVISVRMLWKKIPNPKIPKIR